VLPFLVFYLTGRGYAAAQIAAVISAYGLGGLGGQPLGGYLADRFGRRVTLIGGLLDATPARARQVPGHGAAGEADDGQDATGTKQIAHPGQPAGGGHVMQGGHRRDDIERGGLERVGEEVAEDVVDVVRSW